MEYVMTKLEDAITVDGIYTVHYFEYAKDFAYSGEVHNFWELVYADKKSLYVTAGASEIRLAVGQMYLHRPNEFHNIRCDGSHAAVKFRDGLASEPNGRADVDCRHDH